MTPNQQQKVTEMLLASSRAGEPSLLHHTIVESSYQEGVRDGRLKELSLLRQRLGQMVNNAYGSSSRLKPSELLAFVDLIRRREAEIRRTILASPYYGGESLIGNGRSSSVDPTQGQEESNTKEPNVPQYPVPPNPKSSP